MNKINIGYAFCGSFCTIKKSLEALEKLAQNNVNIIPIMSQIVYSTDTRFIKADELKGKVEGEIDDTTVSKYLKELEEEKIHKNGVRHQVRMLKNISNTSIQTLKK